MNDREKALLRRLAERVAAIAALPEQAARRDMWYAHNDLHSPRAVVLAFPEGAWRELIPQTVLESADPLAREWEMRLRQTIYTFEHLHDDQVTEPVFNIPWVHTVSDYGVPLEHVRTEALGAYTWKPPLVELSDIDKLRFRTWDIDRAETDRRVALAKDIFGDVLAVRIRGMFWWTLGMTWTAILMRGLERLMLDIYDHPEWLSQLMSFLRDATLHDLDYLETNGFLTLNNEDDYVGSGGFGYTRSLPSPSFDGVVRTADMWGFAESQEFVSVSPEKFEEFAFRFQLPLLSRFGLNCYGCCEPVHSRIHLLKTIPRLRRISISAWCDLDIAARELSDRYIFSYKPSPAVLAGEHLDETDIRRTLSHCLDVARGCKVEIIMKDTHTLRGEPERLTRWTEIAREVADEYS